MTDSPDSDLQTVRDRLLACGAIKAWSMIVTILGDLAAAPQARVPGPVLTAICDRMGLKPEALRVAIHRLRRDGWITSQRDGRQSLYGLTAHGRAATVAVSDRVYGPAPGPDMAWLVVIAPNAEALHTIDHPELLPLGPKAALLPAPPEEAADLADRLLVWPVTPGAVPPWLCDLLAPPDLRASYAALMQALDAALALPAPDDPLDRVALRLLALHQWRRLVLRHGTGPEVLMAADWPGAACRAPLARLLGRYPRPDPRTL